LLPVKFLDVCAWLLAMLTIANLPNSAQLEGAPYHSPSLHLGLCSSVGMRRATGRHTDSRGQYTFCLSYASCKI